MSHKNFEKQVTNKNFMPKSFEQAFFHYKNAITFFTEKIKFIILQFKYSKATSNGKVCVDEVQSLEQNPQIC